VTLPHTKCPPIAHAVAASRRRAVASTLTALLLALAVPAAAMAMPKDTDGDGYPDQVELAAGSDPRQKADTPADHAPYQPHVLSFTADPRSPLTRFYVLLDPYADPDGDDVPHRTEWRIAAAKGGPTAYRTEAAAPHGSPPDLMLVPPGALEPAHTYAVSVRHQDVTGLWSAWSPSFELKTARTDPADTDGDGVSDLAEAGPHPAAPVAPGRTEFKDAVQGREVDLEAASGSVEQLTVLRPTDLPAGGRPPDGTLPYGLFGVRVAAPKPGGTVSLTFHLPDTLPDGTRWLDVHPATGPDPRPPRAVVTGHTVTVEVADGGPGDADGVANGVVVSLAGPALAEGPETPVTGPDGNPVVPAADPPAEAPAETPQPAALPGTM
jgi:hypothetical protein